MKVSGITVIAVFVQLLLPALSAAAEDSGGAGGVGGKKLNIVPVISYDYLSLDKLSVSSAGGGALLLGSSCTIAALYARHSFRGDLLYGYPELFHSAEMLADIRLERKNWLAVFKSESDRPVAGGLSTFQAAAVYGYEFVKTDRFSLILGAGIAAGDFGLEFEDGTPWPFIPVPLARMKYSSRLIEASLDFITGPVISMTLAPEKQVRLKNSLMFSQLRDGRDIEFESSLLYRFFAPASETGDIAGIAAGVRGESIGEFSAGGNDETYSLQYYSLFSSLDLAILTVTGSYAFSGRELYNGKHSVGAGDGWSVSLRGMYQF